MARTIAQIQQSIIDAKNANSNLSGLTSNSNVAEWNLWTAIVAICQWTIETLFDSHLSEVQTLLATMKPHTAAWYASMAQAFQYGDALPYGSDTYSVIDPTKQVVKYAAAQEIGSGSSLELAVKVAQATTDSFTGDTVCAQITDTPTLNALSAYMLLVKDAGINLNVESWAGDIHKCMATIYYDPQIINSSGQRLDGTDNFPVDRAIARYLNDLPFNGLLTVDDYISAVKAVPGIIAFKLAALSGTIVIGTVLTDILSIGYYRPSAGYLTYTVGTNQTFTWTVFNG